MPYKKGRAEAMKNLDVPIKANAGNTRDILDFFKLEEMKDAPRVSIEKYEKNLHKILDKMEEHNIKSVFMTTTPVEDERHNTRVAFHRHGADVIRYNDVARSVMAERGIPVIDLYDFTDKLEGEKYRDHVHYLDSVAKMQARFINEKFREIIENY